ncbi:MAG: hypothetical protein ACLQPD_10830 [Desulfomonilaceae bacterium]
MGAGANAREYCGATTLMKATCQGYLDVVKLLLEKGASQLPDLYGATIVPLMPTDLCEFLS